MPIYQYLTKKGIRYCFIISIDNKQYTRRGYLTAKECRQAEREFYLKHQKEEEIKKSITIKDVCILYLDHIKSTTKDGTYNKHKEVINRFIIKDFGKYRPNELKRGILLKYIDELYNRDFSYNYFSAIYTTFNSVMKYGYIYMGLEENPFDKIEKPKSKNKPKEMDFYTIDEFKEFMSVIKNEEHQLMFLLMFYLGLRRGELLALRFNDYSFTNGTLRIDESYSRHGSHMRFDKPKTKSSDTTLSIPQELNEKLHTYTNNIKEKYIGVSGNSYLFGIDRPIAPETLRRWKSHYAKLSHQKDMRIHDFRHSCGSYYLSIGVPIQVVSKIMRHESIEITMRVYLHTDKSEVENTLKNTKIDLF